MSQDQSTQRDISHPVGTSELIIAAMESQFRAKRDKAVAQLSVYINAHVGVPDHPSVVDECSALVQQIAEADDGLRVLKNLLVPSK
jgi:hypothetical protein